MSNYARTLADQNAALTIENQRLTEELKRIYDKLLDGTMHHPLCNGLQDQPVGKEGMICNCPPGQTIRILRKQVAALRQIVFKEWNGDPAVMPAALDAEVAVIVSQPNLL